MARIKKSSDSYTAYAKGGIKMKKMASGGKASSLGMKSVKAGFDKNPGVTRADIIVAAKKQAKKGTMLKKAQRGGYVLTESGDTLRGRAAAEQRRREREMTLDLERALMEREREKRKVIKSSGKSAGAVAKAVSMRKGGAAMKKQAAVAIAMKKAGKTPKKMMGGGSKMKKGY